MKIYSKLFALCVFYPQAYAFIQSPKSLTFQAPIKSNSAVFSDGAGGPPGLPGPHFAKVKAPSVPAKPPASAMSSEVKIQGGSLQTWSFATPAINRVQVRLKTEGRPMNADVELWQGPDNTPQKVGLYIENGLLRPFNMVMETPLGHNSVQIRNTGNLEFPFEAYVEVDVGDSIEHGESLYSKAKILQGGAVGTYPFHPSVQSVQILLLTDGRPLNSRIELLQGPNNKKQVIEIYTEDGLQRPFYAIVETPGVGNVVRIQNTATMEYPLNVAVLPYEESTGFSDQEDLIVLSKSG